MTRRLCHVSPPLAIGVAMLLALPGSSLPGQLTLRVTRIPSATPPSSTLHVAGTFNRWNPGATEFALVRRDSAYLITLPGSISGRIEFKLTLGSWESVETSETGEDIPNRSHTIAASGADTLDIAVEGWRTLFPRPPVKPTASASVTVLADSFAIPQLGRTRRIWIYLPPDYSTSTKRYPVMYMHDGQNLFDAATSFSGEWGVDETLDSLHALGDSGVIVVGVDNGASHRLDEYNPWKATRSDYGGGEGKAYVEFLVRTLKPHIDSRYRTRPGSAHTAIAGSSMGGLISLYAALAHPDVFGRAGVFSCACWISRPEVLAFARAASPSGAHPRLYFIAGGDESPEDEYVHDQHTVVATLRAAGWAPDEIRASIADDGRHHESFWRREFPAAYLWLFGRQTR